MGFYAAISGNFSFFTAHILTISMIEMFLIPQGECIYTKEISDILIIM